MIKYRVWDTAQKKYIDSDDASISGNGILTVVGIEGKYHMSVQPPNDLAPRFIIEQYTGLKDKNGVEIAVGDIAQVKASLVGKVVYSNEYACFEIVGPGFPPYSFAELAETGIDIHSMVVIGNIHENGDLLEER